MHDVVRVQKGHSFEYVSHEAPSLTQIQAFDEMVESSARIMGHHKSVVL